MVIVDTPFRKEDTFPLFPDKNMDEDLASGNRGKRKRENESSSGESSSSESEADSSFMERAEDAAKPLLEMLKDCQLQLISHTNSGGTIDCCAPYTFRRDIKEIWSQQVNDYGRGQLTVVRVGMDGADVHTLPEWMASRISFQAYFEKKVATSKPHSSRDSKKRGFEVPWCADIRLESIPIGCMVESVQLTFICPTGQGCPTIAIHPDHGGNLYYINDRLRNIKGQTYSECCQELGIFRQATVYVKMRVPFRLLMREQLGQLRKGIPVHHPNHLDVDASQMDHTLTLKCGKFGVKVDRSSLCHISQKTEEIFTEHVSGRVKVYEMEYGRDAVSDVVNAGISRFNDFPVDPLEAEPLLLYEMMCLSMDWYVEPLMWVAQFALLERLCTPGFDLGTVPLAMYQIWSCYMVDRVLGNIAKFLLAGFVIVLQSMKSDESAGTLLQRIRRHERLWDSIQDTVEPVVVKIEEEQVKTSENAHLDPRSPPGEYANIRVMLMDGTESHYRVKRSCSIDKMKASIHARLGLPSAGFRLHYKSKRLPEHGSDTVADCGIEDGDILYMYTHMVGC